jgi:arylsulfatase A-like enzyme
MTHRAVLAFLVVLVPALARAADTDRPNILFAIADDWGYPDAGAYGTKAARTPTFDALAAQGMLFTRAFSAAPSCTPSRGSILTGQAPHRLEQGGNLWSDLPPKFAVYPDLLEHAGYAVGSYRKAWGPGKMIDRPRPPAGPVFKSFDAFLATVPADKPFCFWFGASDPHRPYQPQLAEQSGIDPKDVTVPPYLPDTPEVRRDIVDYLAEVQRFDRELGQALKALEASGRAKNTLVIVSADNGWPWPRAKANLYDAGTRQPFVAAWPGRIKPGTKTDRLTVLTDLAPTFLEAAGLPAPADMTGQSLLPLLLGKDVPARDAVFLERERHARAREGNLAYPGRAVRTDRHLYIRNFEPDRWPAGDPEYASASQGAFGDIDAGPTKDYLLRHRTDPAVAPFFNFATAKRPAEELYDVQADPHCLTNLAADPAHAQTKAALAAQLARWMNDTNDPRAANPRDDRWDKYEYHGDRPK